MKRKAAVVWFRRDLRLAGNPALELALREAEFVIPVFFFTPEEERLGGASRWWLHHSLQALSGDLEQRGSGLVLRKCGDPAAELRKIAAVSGAQAVYLNALYDPALHRRDNAVLAKLKYDSIDVQVSNSGLLAEPEEIRNSSGGPYQVFTPFWNVLRKRLGSVAAQAAAPDLIRTPQQLPASAELDSLKLLPRVAWDAEFGDVWRPGENGAQEVLRRFLSGGLRHYSGGRDRPGEAGTSRLSPHLHFGEIGPHQIWRAVQEALQAKGSGVSAAEAESFVRQLGWREFAHHILFHFPHTSEKPLREKFSAFPWRRNKRLLRLWQQGLTGYPIVDAGMNQLWRTGWMHNRVRMIAASFLVKHLLIPWQEGAAWFWDTLVDADEANNILGWQWVAGCGADAAPYFRIFHPVLQGEKFDPEGRYVRAWVPALSRLPKRWLHKPWEAPKAELAAAGIVLGKDYPRPIVDHAEARERALDAYAELSGKP